jgi:hypothetical protein
MAAVDAQITAQARLRDAARRGVVQAWNSLGSYDEQDVSRWLALVVPFLLAVQRMSVTVTDAYVARALGRPPLGLDPLPVIDAVRGDTRIPDVYRRPFVTVWSELKIGKEYEEAVAIGLDRAEASVATDVQLAQRGAMQAIQDADPTIFGYARKADPGACPYCVLLDGAYVLRADALAMHPRCGCSLEPLTGPHPRAAHLPDGRSITELRRQDEPLAGVTVFDHGEYGPTLGDPEHDHLTSAEALAR